VPPEFTVSATIDDNEMVPIDMGALLELEKVKVIVSEEPLWKGGLEMLRLLYAVKLPFTILLELHVPLVSLAVALLTELGMPVKTKVIEIFEIVLLHVLLLYALFDKTT